MVTELLRGLQYSSCMECTLIGLSGLKRLCEFLSHNSTLFIGSVTFKGGVCSYQLVIRAVDPRKLSISYHN
jgi:hypothetical protein